MGFKCTSLIFSIWCTTIFLACFSIQSTRGFACEDFGYNCINQRYYQKCDKQKNTRSIKVISVCPRNTVCVQKRPNPCQPSKENTLEQIRLEQDQNLAIQPSEEKAAVKQILKEKMSDSAPLGNQDETPIKTPPLSVSSQSEKDLIEMKNLGPTTSTSSNTTTSTSETTTMHATPIKEEHKEETHSKSEEHKEGHEKSEEHKEGHEKSEEHKEGHEKSEEDKEEGHEKSEEHHGEEHKEDHEKTGEHHGEGHKEDHEKSGEHHGEGHKEDHEKTEEHHGEEHKEDHEKTEEHHGEEHKGEGHKEDHEKTEEHKGGHEKSEEHKEGHEKSEEHKEGHEKSEDHKEEGHEKSGEHKEEESDEDHVKHDNAKSDQHAEHGNHEDTTKHPEEHTTTTLEMKQIYEQQKKFVCPDTGSFPDETSKECFHLCYRNRRSTNEGLKAIGVCCPQGMFFNSKIHKCSNCEKKTDKTKINRRKRQRKRGSRVLFRV